MTSFRKLGNQKPGSIDFSTQAAVMAVASGVLTDEQLAARRRPTTPAMQKAIASASKVDPRYELHATGRKVQIMYDGERVAELDFVGDVTRVFSRVEPAHIDTIGSMALAFSMSYGIPLSSETRTKLQLPPSDIYN